MEAELASSKPHGHGHGGGSAQKAPKRAAPTPIKGGKENRQQPPQQQEGGGGSSKKPPAPLPRGKKARLREMVSSTPNLPTYMYRSIAYTHMFIFKNKTNKQTNINTTHHKNRRGSTLSGAAARRGAATRRGAAGRRPQRPRRRPTTTSLRPVAPRGASRLRAACWPRAAAGEGVVGLATGGGACVCMG